MCNAGLPSNCRHGSSYGLREGGSREGLLLLLLMLLLLAYHGEK